MLGTIVDRRLSKGFERIARAHLKRQVEDPELRGKLRPNYTLGCKRIPLSDTYYPRAHAAQRGGGDRPDP